MKLAIFSDIHDNPDGWAKTLHDAERCHADSYISLGDVGRNPQLFYTLRDKKIPCVYGNWEVSTWPRMPRDIGQWIAEWPTSMSLSALLASANLHSNDNEPPLIEFTHATPAMPPIVTQTQEMTIYLNSGHNWTHVYPRLHRNEQAVWDALGVMEEKNILATFHGHTHVQMVWQWAARQAGTKRSLTAVNGPTEFELQRGNQEEPSRYLIGVGSCGEPHDGEQLRYALLDTDTLEVELRAIS